MKIKHNAEGQELMDLIQELLIRADQKVRGLQRCLNTAEDLAERAELDEGDLEDMKALARAVLTWEMDTLTSPSQPKDRELMAELLKFAGERPLERSCP